MYMYARAHTFGHAFLPSLYLKRFSLGAWKFQGFAGVEILRLQQTQHKACFNALHYGAAGKEACKCGLWPRYFTKQCVNSCNWNVHFMCSPEIRYRVSRPYKTLAKSLFCAPELFEAGTVTSCWTWLLPQFYCDTRVCLSFGHTFGSVLDLFTLATLLFFCRFLFRI
jgi:hypothetical protein